MIKEIAAAAVDVATALPKHAGDPGDFRGIRVLKLA